MKTCSIIDPPVNIGGISASSSARAHRQPTPVGPSILCPLKAMKSASKAATSTGMCGTDWQASTTTSAPTACASRATSATGLIVPSTFD